MTMGPLGAEALPARGGLRRRGRSVPADRTSPFDVVRVHRELGAAAEAFNILRRGAPASPYQQVGWLDAWIGTVGVRRGIQPMIVVAHDASGSPVALLPFGIAIRKGLRCAEFLGGRETNYNLGLFDPAAAWRTRDVVRLLKTAAALAGGLDLYRFIHQPESWDGVANPLAALPRTQPSPSFSHRAVLMPDGEAFLRAHLSGPARKKLRAKTAHLAALGPVSHEVVRDTPEIRQAVDAHLRQKGAKLESLGIGQPDTATLAALLERACRPAPGYEPPLELHALRCGDRIVATFGGLPDRERGRFSGLLISHDPQPDYARCSPGELLLATVLREKCAQGFRTLDLGVGEARYKDSYCPVPDPLVDCVLPLTIRGHAAATVALAVLRGKAAVKQSPRAWAAARAFRKWLGTFRQR